jgi:hypothetical protein
VVTAAAVLASSLLCSSSGAFDDIPSHRDPKNNKRLAIKGLVLGISFCKAEVTMSTWYRITGPPQRIPDDCIADDSFCQKKRRNVQLGLIEGIIIVFQQLRSSCRCEDGSFVVNDRQHHHTISRASPLFRTMPPELHPRKHDLPTIT